jgi:hypothetical protein
MEVGADPLRYHLADAQRLLQVAQAGHVTPREEPKWFSSARLRAAPLPSIWSSSLVRSVFDRPAR